MVYEMNAKPPSTAEWEEESTGRKNGNLPSLPRKRLEARD